jgi:gluconokinase
VIVVVMGVTGVGKTTVGNLLAQQLGWTFLDADDFHPEANLAKMRRGVPLNDEDRRPWLETLHAELTKRQGKGENVVLACSALKEEYRKTLAAGLRVSFVYLKGNTSLIAERLRERRDHFADDRILSGQFADLEEPDGAVVIDVAATPQEIVSRIREKLEI